MSNWGKTGLVVLGARLAIMPAHASKSFNFIPAIRAAADVSDTSMGPAAKI
jgi:hypothetical protein